jgi:HrpA-like RNA helicase
MPETVPEIQRCNLANVVLYLKVCGEGGGVGKPSRWQALGEASRVR